MPSPQLILSTDGVDRSFRGQVAGVESVLIGGEFWRGEQVVGGEKSGYFGWRGITQAGDGDMRGEITAFAGKAVMVERIL